MVCARSVGWQACVSRVAEEMCGLRGVIDGLRRVEVQRGGGGRRKESVPYEARSARHEVMRGWCHVFGDGREYRYAACSF